MDKLAITVGEGVNRQDTQGTKLVTWESLARRLAKFRVDSMTVDKYHALTQEGQAKVKDGEYLIGGPFKEDRRRREDFIGRWLVSLDADFFKRITLFDVEMAFAEWANVIYSTHSFIDERPKVRIFLPLKRMLTDPREYQAVARWLAAQLDIEAIDHTCFRVTQLMFLPSRCVDGREYYRSNKGPWVDPDEILASYDGDALNSLNWPRSERESRIVVGVERAGNPYKKPGLVGWFNTQFSVHAVLADQRFSVSSEFEQVAGDRYLPVGSHGGPGAVVYPSEPQLDDDAFLFVNHQTAPYGNKNLCAWDLVRIGEFGDWTDEEVAKETPLRERESQCLMNDLVRQLQEFQANPMEELEELPDEDIEDAKNQFASDAVDAMETAADDMTEGAQEENLEKPDRLTVALMRSVIDTATTENHLRKATNAVGASGFSASDKGILAKMIQEKYKALDLHAPTVAEIRSDILRIAKGTSGRDDSGDPEIDIEDALVTRVLDEHFDGGTTIKRLANVFWQYFLGVWRMLNPDVIHQVLDNELIGIRKEQPELAHALMAVLNDTKTTTLSNALWGLLQRRVTEPEHLDPLGLLELDKPSIVNCLNGEVHFDTVDGFYEFLPHDPTHYLTHQIKCNFDVSAKCPMFDEALQRIFRDCEDTAGVIRHFEEICGYLVQLRRDRKIWVLWHGSGDNGKTTLATILLALLGEAGYAVQNITKVDDDKHWTAGVTNALVLVDDDYPAGQLLPDAAIKKFSEAKELTANPKFGGQFAFICRAPVMILSNSWPETKDVSDALVSRAHVFDFNTKIEAHERDEQLRERIVTGELPGVLNRLLEGYARVIERGDWDLPEDCARARAMWSKSANVVNMWLDENVIVTEDPGDVVEQMKLWLNFESWSLQERVRGGLSTMSKRGFYQRLDAMGFTRRGLGKNRQGYVGLQIRVNDEPMGESE